MNGLVIDLFAGGGGASVALEKALGRPVDIAINHDPTAIAVHRTNHPGTVHLDADVWEVRPLDATGGRPVDVLWASPDCRHFSVAKGDVPRSPKIRSLAWVVVRWAREVKPQRIFLENVQEFRGWGPLGRDGKPDKSKAGKTFRAWKRSLERLGYVVDYRVLDASQYGAPTRRRRLFLVARLDGGDVVWPEPTHGPGRAPLRTAAECIDWSIPCPSIFERKRPLAEKTMWRIAQGIRKFVIESANPFIIKVNHGRWEPRHESIDEPLSTVTATQRGHALVTPFVAEPGQRHGRGQKPGDEPLSTIVGKDRHAVVAPALVRYQAGDSDRYLRRGQQLDLPLSTLDCSNRFGVIAPTLIQTGYGERPGQAARVPGLGKPLGTCVDGQKHALVSAWLAKHYGDPMREEGGGAVVGTELHEPIGTVTGRDHHSLAAVTFAKFNGNAENGHPGCLSLEEPMPTITSGGGRGGGHVAEVRAFLTAYYGSDATSGQSLEDPMRTATARARFGLVLVDGVEHQIVDIGMRMLEPHELLRAQFGRYAAGYDLSEAKTKAAKIRLIGNSVPPEPAELLIRANMPSAEARAA